MEADGPGWTATCQCDTCGAELHAVGVGRGQVGLRGAGTEKKETARRALHPGARGDRERTSRPDAARWRPSHRDRAVVAGHDSATYAQAHGRHVLPHPLAPCSTATSTRLIAASAAHAAAACTVRPEADEVMRRAEDIMLMYARSVRSRLPLPLPRPALCLPTPRCGAMHPRPMYRRIKRRRRDVLRFHVKLLPGPGTRDPMHTAWDSVRVCQHCQAPSLSLRLRLPLISYSILFYPGSKHST
jgi:hypothetical protein